MGQLCYHQESQSDFDLSHEINRTILQLKSEEKYKPIKNYLSQIKTNNQSNQSSSDPINIIINLGIKHIKYDQSVFMTYDCLHVLTQQILKKSQIEKISYLIFKKKKWAQPHCENTPNLQTEQSTFSKIISEYSPIEKLQYLDEFLKEEYRKKQSSRQEIIKYFKDQLENQDRQIQNQFYFQIRFIQDFYPQSYLEKHQIDLLADLLQGVIELNQPKFNFKKTIIEERQFDSYKDFVNKSQQTFLGYLKVLIQSFASQLLKLDQKFNIPYETNNIQLNFSLFKQQSIDILKIDYNKSYQNYKQDVVFEEWPYQIEIQKTFFHLNRESIIIQGIKIWNSIYQIYLNQLFKVDCIKYIVALTTHSIYTFYGYLFMNKGIDKQLLFLICQGISEVLIFPTTNNNLYHTPTQTFNYLCKLSLLEDEINCSAELLNEKDNLWRLNQYEIKFNDIQDINKLLKQFEFTNTYLNFSYVSDLQKHNYNQLYQFLKSKKEEKNSQQLKI